MSAPRPAMLVAIVTAPGWPASCDDLGLALVLLGVQHVVRHAARARACSTASRRSRSQIVPTSTGWPVSCALGDLLDDRVVLLAPRLVDEVVLVVADHRPVGRDRHDLELVDLAELVRLGRGRAGHAGELLVHAEVVLDRDRRDRVFSASIFTPSLASTAWCRPSDQRRPSMMRPVNSSTIMTSPSCDDVLDVALVERLGLQRLDQVVDELAVAGRVQVLDAERLLDLVHAVLGRRRPSCASRRPRSPRGS